MSLPFKIKSFLNPKSLVLFDQAVYSGTGFLSTLLLVRLLTPVDFGIFTSIFLGVIFVINSCNALIIQPLQVNLSAVDDKDKYISFALVSQLILLAALLCLGAIIRSMEVRILDYFNTDFVVVALYASGFLLHDFFRKVFLAKEDITSVLIIDSLVSFFHIGLLVICSLGPEIGLRLVFQIIGISYLPALGGALYFQKFKKVDKPSFLWYFEIHKSQGSWLLLTAVFQWWASNLFVVASGAILGAKALGAFRLIQSVFGVLNVLLQAIENYALPLGSRILSSSIVESKRFLKRLSVKTTLFASLILMLTFTFPKHFIMMIAGEAYIEYYYIVQAMSILYLIIFMGYPIRLAIRMLKLNRAFFVGYLFTFSFSIITFNYLLNEWHLYGAMIGLIANQIIAILYWQYILIRKQYFIWK